jgi:hypothetical protein
VDSKKIITLVLAFVFLALAGYTTYTLIKIIPIANEFFNVGKDPQEIQTQREDAQQIYNNLLEGNKK